MFNTASAMTAGTQTVPISMLPVPPLTPKVLGSVFQSRPSSIGSAPRRSTGPRSHAARKASDCPIGTSHAAALPASAGTARSAHACSAAAASGTSPPTAVAAAAAMPVPSAPVAPAAITVMQAPVASSTVDAAVALTPASCPPDSDTTPTALTSCLPEDAAAPGVLVAVAAAHGTPPTVMPSAIKTAAVAAAETGPSVTITSTTTSATATTTTSTTASGEQDEKPGSVKAAVHTDAAALKALIIGIRTSTASGGVTVPKALAAADHDAGVMQATGLPGQVCKKFVRTSSSASKTAASMPTTSSRMPAATGKGNSNLAAAAATPAAAGAAAAAAMSNLQTTTPSTNAGCTAPTGGLTAVAALTVNSTSVCTSGTTTVAAAGVVAHSNAQGTVQASAHTADSAEESTTTGLLHLPAEAKSVLWPHPPKQPPNKVVQTQPSGLLQAGASASLGSVAAGCFTAVPAPRPRPGRSYLRKGFLNAPAKPSAALSLAQVQVAATPVVEAPMGVSTQLVPQHVVEACMPPLCQSQLPQMGEHTIPAPSTSKQQLPHVCNPHQQTGSTVVQQASHTGTCSCSSAICQVAEVKLAATCTSCASVGVVPARCPIQSLPIDVLTEVFTYLPARTLAAVMQVCVEWREAASQPALWQTLAVELDIHLPHNWFWQQQDLLADTRRQSPDLMVLQSSQPEHSSALGLQPRPPAAAHLVAGVQSIRVLRAVAATSQSTACSSTVSRVAASTVSRAASTVSVTPKQLSTSPTPTLHEAVGAALKQRANWQTGRYKEMRLREHSANVECAALVSVQPWGPCLVTGGWDGAVCVHHLWPDMKSTPPAQLGSQCAACPSMQTAAKTSTHTAANQRTPTAASPPQQTTPCQIRPPAASPLLGTSQGSEGHVAGQGEDRGSASQGWWHVWSWAGHQRQDPTLVRRFVSHTGWITSMAAGQRFVVTGSTDKRVAMCAYADPGPAPRTVMLLPSEVTTVRFAYSGCEWWVLAGSTDGSLRLLDLQAKQVVCQFLGHRDAVCGMAHIPGHKAISISRDGNLCCWMLPVLQCQTSRSSSSAGNPCTRRTQVPVGSNVSSSSAASATLSMQQQQRCSMSERTVSGNTCNTTPVERCQDSGDDVGWTVVPEHFGCRHARREFGRMVDTSSFPQGDLLWPQQVAPCPEEAFRLGRINGTACASSGQNGASPVACEPVQAVHAHANVVLCMDVHVVTGCAACSNTGVGNGKGFACMPGMAHQQHLLPCYSTQSSMQYRRMTGQESCNVSKPGVLVATGGGDTLVQIWDFSSTEHNGPLKPMHTLHGHTHGVLSVCFGMLPCEHASTNLAARAPLDQAANTSTVEDRKKQCTRALLAGSKRSGRKLVLLSGSVKEVRVWDPWAGTCLAQLQDHSGPVVSLAVCNGLVLTLGMNDGLMVYTCLARTTQKASSAVMSNAAQAGTLKPKWLKPVLALMDDCKHATCLVACPQLVTLGTRHGEIVLLDFSNLQGHV